MDEKPSVHAGHRGRLRDRYRQNGADHFNDYEMLELLLGYAIPQKDTNPLAHKLIDRFGDLRNVLNAGEDALVRSKLVGPTTAFFLSMLPDISRRYYEQLDRENTRLMTPRQCIDFFIPHFIGRKKECIMAAFLDEAKLLIDFAIINEGARNTVQLHTPSLLREAKKRGCRYVVLAHNHFTDPIPSIEDLGTTRRARGTLLDAGIGLCDHIILCGTNAISMQESGHFKLTIPRKDKKISQSED